MKKTEDDSGTEHFGGKNDKKGPKHSFLSPMLNPMLYAILELILWHKYENKDEYKETKKKEKSLKINNQWRDNKVI